MFRKKVGLEIEGDEEGGKSAEALRAGGPGSAVVPKWARILHWTAHGLSAVLIIVLLVTLILVEVDSKDDGKDGTPNKILTPFGLQVDGCPETQSSVVQCTADTAAGGSSSINNNGNVQAAIAYQKVIEEPGHEVDEIFQYADRNATVLMANARPHTMEEHVEYLRSSPVWPRKATDGVYEYTPMVLPGNRIVVEIQRKTKNGELFDSYFASSTFKDGMIISHRVYPNLSFEAERMGVVEEFQSIYNLDVPLTVLDTLVTDDFISMSRYGDTDLDGFKELVGQAKSTTLAAPGITVAQRETYVTGPMIISRYEILNADGVVIASGYSEFHFVGEKIDRYHWYEVTMGSPKTAVAATFDQVFTNGDYETWGDLVTDDWLYHDESGEVRDLEHFQRRIERIFKPQMEAMTKLGAIVFNEMVEMNGVVFDIWSVSIKGMMSMSGIQIHHFDDPDDSLKISSTYSYSTNDVGRLLNAVELFAGISQGDDVDLDELDDLVSEDFRIDTFWGGWEDYEEFKGNAANWIKRMQTPGELSQRLNTRKTIKRTVSRNAVVDHGYWLDSDGNQGTSFADIFYFDRQGKLETLYVYNSTAAMGQIE